MGNEDPTTATRPSRVALKDVLSLGNCCPGFRTRRQSGALGWQPQRTYLPQAFQGIEGHEKQPALTQADFPKWFAELRKRDVMATRCLEFALLVRVARRGEVRGATWDEIDLEACILEDYRAHA